MPDQTARRDRTRRRRCPRLREDVEVTFYPGPTLGPDLVTADPETVMEAFRGFDFDSPWEEVRDRIVPLLPRLRPYPVALEGLVRAMVPPGILTGFGLDLGPAVANIGQAQVDGWGIDVPTLTAAALGNVRRIAAGCDPETVHRRQLVELEVAIVQSGHGLASTFLLVPDCLERLIGPGPNLLLAPMRDILLALPADVDPGLATWLSAEWEALDPNCLHLGAFLYRDGRTTGVALDGGARLT